MARYRLRYQATDLELIEGEFAIGRSSECNLALDDPLVSRKHAIFHVAKDGVELEDLKSRNGVQLNGTKLSGRVRLKHLDRVQIGSQEMVLLEISEREHAKRPTSVMSICPACRLPVTPGDRVCAHCGAPIEEGRATLEIKHAWTGAEEDTRKASALTLLASVADKALALGRVDEAERILTNLLGDLLAKAQQGKAPADGSIQDATRYALKLADALSKPRWVDWVFQVHDATGRLMTADTIDTLYAIVRKVRHPGGRAVRDYVRNMKSKSSGFSASERFLLQRLEGLERIVGA